MNLTITKVEEFSTSNQSDVYENYQERVGNDLEIAQDINKLEGDYP